MALAVVTDCPPETGGTSEAEGVDSFPFSVCKVRGEGLTKNVDLRSLMSLRITLTGFHALCAQLFSIIGFIPLPLYGTLRRSGCFTKPLYKNWQ